MYGSKGGLVRPLAAGVQLVPSFSGVHMEVAGPGVEAALPLAPGRSVALPLALQVGRAPSDSYEGVELEVRGGRGFIVKGGRGAGRQRRARLRAPSPSL